MYREGCNCWKPTMRGQCLPLLQLKYIVLKRQHLFYIDKLVPIFTNQVIGTICQSNTYFFLLPLTQCLISSWQNKKWYSTLLMEYNSFMSALYVGASVPCFVNPDLGIAQSHCNGMHYPTSFGWVRWQSCMQCATWK